MGRDDPRSRHNRELAIARAVAFLALILGALAHPAAAQDAGAFYRGKTVRFVVGVGVGGGYDAYARLIAPALGRALGANVVVENQLGAGGLVALNRIAAAPGDGLSLMIVNGTPAALGQILGQQNVRYDLTKLDHLGIVVASPWIWMLSEKSAVKNIGDALAGKLLRWGGSGPTDGLADGAALTCAALKLNCQMILGYKGSNDIALALETGELDAMYVSDGSAAAYERARHASGFASMAHERSKLLPGAPSIFEITKPSGDGEWLLSYRARLNDLGRILVTSPNTPPERLSVLRAAVKSALTDPALIEEGLRTERQIAFQEPAVAQKLAAAALLDLTPAQKARVVEAVLGGIPK